MKRYWTLALLLLTASALKGQTPAQQPVFFYLYATVSDHVNLDVSEARLRYLLPMIEGYRKEHPQAHVVATVLFSGAISQALDQQNAKTHIKDFVLDYKKRGIIEIGYDGTDEPTYEHRPIALIPERTTPEQRWQIRAAADEKFLTEARDPITGAVLPGAVGGLQEMQRVFGEAACIRGASVGTQEKLAPLPPGVTMPLSPSQVAAHNAGLRPEVGDWELVPVMRRYNSKAVLFGFPEANPGNLPGFKGSVLGVGAMMSPVPESSPELYWVDNILRTAEWSGGKQHVVRVLHGYEGVDAFKTFAADIERTRIQIVHVELASEADYLTPAFVKLQVTPVSNSPALTYAYAHPADPKLPADARVSDADVKASHAKEEAALTWLTSDFVTANPGSRLISSSDFKRMTPPATGFSISMAGLTSALTGMLTKWGNDTFPPNYLMVEGHYLSLADLFQVMTDSLAQMDRTGKLPQSVTVVKVYGPIGMAVGHGPNLGEMSVAAIAKECSTLAVQLHNDTADPMPKNAIPTGVVVDGVGVNAAQFLKMMAHAIVNPVPETKVTVKMTFMFPGPGEVLPRSRTMEDLGATWTFKPAPIDVHFQ